MSCEFFVASEDAPAPLDFVDETFDDVAFSVNEIIEHELCIRCSAKRVLQYPLGMTLDSDPKPVPKNCPVILDSETPL